MSQIIQVTTVHPWWDNRIFEKIVTGLRSRRHDVLYVCQAGTDDAAAIPGPVVILPTGSGFAARIRRNLKAFRECARRPGAIVHFHDPEFVPFGLLLRLIGHRVIYDVHEDNLLAIPQKGSLPRWMRVIVARAVAAMEAVASRFLTIVIAERAYRGRFPGGVAVLNYPSALSGPGLTGGGQAIAAKPDRRKLLYTGCLSEDRGALNHVRLLRLLPDYELHLVGRCDARLRDRMLAVAGESRSRLHLRVSEEGVPFSEITKAYLEGGWCWGLALFPDTPHYRDKELTKFFEYMSFRIPIICSDFPAWRRLIDGRFGIVVDADSLETVAEAIRTQDARFQEYREQPIGIPAEFTWESQLDSLERLYSGKE